MKSFRNELESDRKKHMLYDSPYNDFWKWKIEVEGNGRGNILDDNHRRDTGRKLLDILPGWQTYHGVKCDYETWLPVSLNNIANAYGQIRNCSLLDFDRISDEPLKLVWHELGRVKTESGNRTTMGEYSVIAVCKPLMFIWGQTPPFDSINRGKMYLPYGNSWCFEWWKEALEDLQKELFGCTAVISYCKKKATQIYKSEYVVPYGRFLDIYYY